MKRYRYCQNVIEKISNIDQLLKKLDDGCIKDIITEYQIYLKEQEKEVDSVHISHEYQEIIGCMGSEGAYNAISVYAKTGRYSRAEITEKIIEYIIDNLDIQEINYTKYLVVSYRDYEYELLTPMKDLVKLILKDMTSTDMPGGTTKYVYSTGGDERDEVLDGDNQ